ncbi:class I tRNA ligase family protein [Actinobacillus pleuropneumoniae]|nr:class I tRNA ligase family protein [Actinobacillus pleuropneumoniae]UQZ25772.1 class I tRNA ligase family protein [Actinobacillus pleuropneumoniae]
MAGLVANDGKFISSTPVLCRLRRIRVERKKYWKKLKEVGALLKLERIKHSYPHCWRHKTPIIFRATPQWFIGMETQGLREQALGEIKSVRWIPSWGGKRVLIPWWQTVLTGVSLVNVLGVCQ